MNLLFCALGIYSRVGGIERFNQRALRAAAELWPRTAGSSCALVLWDDPQEAGVPHPVRFLGCGGNKARMLLRFLSSLLGPRPDVILYGHILLAPLAVLGRLLRPHARHLLIAHGYEVWDKPNPLLGVLVRRLMTGVISVSFFTAQKMAAAYRLQEDRFLILPNATDVTGRASVLKSHPREELRLLTVARLTDQDGYKGHEQVIRALPAVLAEFPHTHYYIVGSGPLMQFLRELSDQLGIGRHVHLLGYLDDHSLQRIYSGCDIFVMPSRREGFGIAFLEAWKHALPVIAGNLDASQEVVRHGLTGLIVNPESPGEIAAAVMSLLADPARRKQMGENGRATLLDKYTHEKFRARFEQVLS